MMDYSAEQASSVMAEWANIHERLERRLNQIDLAMDLRRAIEGMLRHQRRVVRRFIENGYRPATHGGRFIDPVTLIEQANALLAVDEVREANMLMRTVKEIRTCRAVAVGMSGRRARPPVRLEADRRLHGKQCARCGSRVVEKEAVFWDRDWGTVWHDTCPGGDA